MRLAITGATGILGRSLVMEAKEHDLLLIGRTNDELNAWFEEGDRMAFLATDYSAEHLGEHFDGIDAVAHLAAIRHDSSKKSLLDYADNITITEHVLEACAQRKICNVVFTSSRAVYSPAVNHVPFTEAQAVFPRLLYGLSKLVAECLCMARTDVCVKCLRLSQLMAPDEREGYLFRTMLDRASQGQDLVLFGEGVGRREYLYVRDAARAVLAALNRPDEAGVFNVGSGVGTSHRELVELMNEVFANGQCRIVADPGKKEDTSTVLMDSTKFRDTFDWAPAFSLVEALRDIKERREA